MGEKYQKIKTACMVCSKRMGIEGFLGKPHGLEGGKMRWK